MTPDELDKAFDLIANHGLTADQAEKRLDADKTHQPMHPNIVVSLHGIDGNAFSILGRVSGTMQRMGVSQTDREAFMAEATSGDYDHLLRTVVRWVTLSDE